ncbi:hypothetical protein MIV116R [Invertebrate iridescent virus 3]|uniref:Uncharacterized protein 116R n=1 Tax=Invertebrate iridescent virus 3 TaxID=345201 RepID=116R_IIV3|nr:hypothetical protein MIV116R [Invertebrate iridescent virus 3]Q196U4.1 RecName: Full=Uncharacterized protein 116R [Invertebrate iridescent virus 3]ABF82146.1 hypothetical protein MIV116R [Invertebrate iridescent virus 3]
MNTNNQETSNVVKLSVSRFERSTKNRHLLPILVERFDSSSPVTEWDVHVFTDDSHPVYPVFQPLVPCVFKFAQNHRLSTNILVDAGSKVTSWSCVYSKKIHPMVVHHPERMTGSFKKQERNDISLWIGTPTRAATVATSCDSSCFSSPTNDDDEGYDVCGMYDMRPPTTKCQGCSATVSPQSNNSVDEGYDVCGMYDMRPPTTNGHHATVTVNGQNKPVTPPPGIATNPNLTWTLRKFRFFFHQEPETTSIVLY